MNEKFLSRTKKIQEKLQTDPEKTFDEFSILVNRYIVKQLEYGKSFYRIGRENDLTLRISPVDLQPLLQAKACFQSILILASHNLDLKVAKRKLSKKESGHLDWDVMGDYRAAIGGILRGPYRPANNEDIFFSHMFVLPTGPFALGNDIKYGSLQLVEWGHSVFVGTRNILRVIFGRAKLVDSGEIYSKPLDLDLDIVEQAEEWLESVETILSSEL